MNIRAHVFIQGNVQGVFYRSWTKGIAEGMGLKGWVKNLEDGRVEAVFEGEKSKVDEMVEKCKEGSKNARVIHIDVSLEEAQDDFVGFSIIP